MRDRILTLLCIWIGLIALEPPLAIQAAVETGGKAAIASAPTQIELSIQNQAMLPKSLQTLVNATIVDGACTGYAAIPGQNYLAYQDAKSLEISVAQLQQLQANASPVGQLYLAALIRNLDSVKGTQLLKDLSMNQSEIPRISGCIVLKTTVGAIATELLNSPTAFDL